LAASVKPRRKYSSQHRAAQAAETRIAVARSARGLFIAEGWQGTTIAGVAQAAGVSPETVYATFGNKPALLMAAIEVTVRRDDPATPLVRQSGPSTLKDAPDQSAVLNRFARDIADRLAHVAELAGVARSAAKFDPALAGLYRRLHEGRRENLEKVTKALLLKGPLKPGVGRKSATATIWRLASPDLFLLMTGVEGMNTGQYARWLEATLAALLLPKS
jgi:AcrR family transcriptional regulator